MTAEFWSLEWMREDISHTLGEMARGFGLSVEIQDPPFAHVQVWLDGVEYMGHPLRDDPRALDICLVDTVHFAISEELSLKFENTLTEVRHMIRGMFARAFPPARSDLGAVVDIEVTG